jgi:hypothetical protein
MKKVLILSVMLVVVLSLPSAAAYKVNWTTTFDNYNGAVLAPLPVHTIGQDKWQLADNPSYTDEVPMDVKNGAGPDGSKAVVMRGGTGSLHNAAFRDMTNGLQPYYKGWARFWVYDPGFVSTSGVDARVGVYGDQGENNIGKMATAQIQDASTRDPNYWWAQWSYSVGKMDGTTPIGGGAGFAFTQGIAAPRVWGAWSYVTVQWSYVYNKPGDVTSGGAGQIKWYVNSTTAALTLDFDSSSGRWNNLRDVQGIFMGSGMTTVHNYIPLGPAKFDNVEFHGIFPEPSSLLAVGAGLLSLAGLRFRRK